VSAVEMCSCRRQGAQNGMSGAMTFWDISPRQGASLISRGEPACLRASWLANMLAHLERRSFIVSWYDGEEAIGWRSRRRKT